jgi:hypothetical protein
MTSEQKSHFWREMVRILIFAVIFDIIYSFYQSAASTAPLVNTVISCLVAGILLGTVLDYTATKLPFGKLARISLIWLMLFVVQMFSNLLEGVFFTTVLSTLSLFVGVILISGLVTLAESVVASFVFPAAGTAKSFRVAFSTYLKGRTASSWAWRVALSAAVYLPIYFAFGAIISPYVLPYYTNPENGLGLVVPGFQIILPLELARGLLYILALIPIIASITLPRTKMYVAVLGLLYVAGAYIPVVGIGTLPIFLRMIHGMEIFADFAVLTAIIIYLLSQHRPIKEIPNRMVVQTVKA